MNLLATLSSDWAALSPAQQVFYGISVLAAFVIVVLGIFQLIGFEFHADFDHPDHSGASLISVKPLVGFAFGFGWAGGYCAGRMGFVPALLVALFAGVAAMLFIWGIVRVFVQFQNDGSMKMESAIGKEGIVYTTIDPHAGGQIQVVLNTGLETLPAVTQETEPISTGKTVTVIRLDGPKLLVESKKT